MDEKKLEKTLDSETMKLITLSAQKIKEADYLLFMSGAGLGVDSGLPDFRGVEGFWRAYPPMKHLGLKFEDMSTPEWFEKDPQFAWGFFGHRYQLYTYAKPHEGYNIMKSWGEDKKSLFYGKDNGKGNYFCVTSNVDGHWGRSGVPPNKIYEIHGTVMYLQSATPQKPGKPLVKAWKNEEMVNLQFDDKTFKATTELPKMPNGTLARPNVLMFDDFTFDQTRSKNAQRNFTAFQQVNATMKLCIIEIGAGKYVPSIRHLSESVLLERENHDISCSLIRINPRDFDVPESSDCAVTIALKLGGLEALKAIKKVQYVEAPIPEFLTGDYQRKCAHCEKIETGLLPFRRCIYLFLVSYLEMDIHQSLNDQLGLLEMGDEFQGTDIVQETVTALVDGTEATNNAPAETVVPPTTSAIAPLGFTPVVRSVVANIKISVGLDLRDLAMRTRNSEYNPKRFPGLIFRINTPKVTCLLFPGGRIVSVGGKTEEVARLSLRKMVRILQKLGVKEAKFVSDDFKIQNMIANCAVGFPVRLEGLVYAHSRYCRYEPEVFSGLIYHMTLPKVCLLIWVSGRIVITGARDRRDIQRAYENIYSVLVDFKQGATAPNTVGDEQEEIIAGSPEEGEITFDGGDDAIPDVD